MPSAEPLPRPKRIIIACDGTSFSASRGERAISSNVTRICHALEQYNESGFQQIVFYQSGVGTGSLGKLYAKISGASGLGLDDNVCDAYHYLINNYREGDEVFCFGWSRGAFTARVLAGFIVQVGVFRKDYSWELKNAYKKYQGGKEDIDVRHEAPRSLKVKIKVLGCWDTVASMGIPDYWFAKSFNLNAAAEFYDPSLHDGIENAFHALSLDETRFVFAPTLFYLPSKLGDTTINLKQVWFPGGHTNVGGGHSDMHLANLTLAWMVDQCRPFLAFRKSYIDMVIRLDHKRSDINSALRRKGGYDKTYPGWGLGKLIPGMTWAWRVLGKKVRYPAAMTSADMGGTNEEIHASARVRWEKMSDWRPESLKGFTPREGQNGLWEWLRSAGNNGLLGWFKTSGGKLVIPEHAFPNDASSFEYQLRYYDDKRA